MPDVFFSKHHAVNYNGVATHFDSFPQLADVGKNVGLLSIPIGEKMCVAAFEADDFRCVASAAHFFIGRFCRLNTEKIQNSTMEVLIWSIIES